MAQKGEGDDSDDNLAAVDVACAAVGPVVGWIGEDGAVGGANGDVYTNCEAVEKQGPKDVREEEELEGLLAGVRIDVKMVLSAHIWTYS